jgi:acyl carrier protein
MTIDEILGPILRTEDKPLKMDDSPKTLSTWDSITHVQVILAVEEAIGRDLPAADALKLTSIRSIMEIFRKYGLAVKLSLKTLLLHLGLE